MGVLYHDQVLVRVATRRVSRTFFVYCIHSSEVVHVFQVDVDLDNLLPGGPCSLQHGSEVSDALRLSHEVMSHGTMCWPQSTYGMLLNATFDDFAIRATWSLPTEKDQSGDFRGVL